MSDNPMGGLEAINAAAHKALRGKPKPQPAAPQPAVSSCDTPNLNPQEITVNNNNNNNNLPARRPNGFAVGVDSALGRFDQAAGLAGELLVPAALGGGIGFGIVRAAGDRIPGQYRLPVIAGCAIVFLAGKLIVQALTANHISTNGGIPAHQRWDIARATKYIHAAQEAGVPDEVIFADLKALGAPVVEAPAAALAAG